jgi:type IV pilus assembly protein PilA
MRIERRSRGFTLIELMIVVAIIGVLAVLAVVGYRAVINSSRTAEPRQFIMTVRLQEESYKAETGAYADISGGYGALCPAGAGSGTTKKYGWDPNCGATQPWKNIGATPDGPVLFGYAAVANPNCTVLPIPPASVMAGGDFRPIAGAVPCYAVYAKGDLNGGAINFAEVMGNSTTKDLTVVDQQ